MSHWLAPARLRLPVIVAPMAGVSSPRFAAKCSKAGLLGSLGCGNYPDGETLRNDIRQIRAETDRPFLINLFAAAQPRLDDEEVREGVKAAASCLQKYYTELGISSPKEPKLPASFEELLAVVLDEKVPYFSFCFGLLERSVVEALQRNGTQVVGTATTVQEALLLEESGVDAIVAQGADAGGHRGSFTAEASLVGTMSLVPQIASAVREAPVVAAGGIMDARGILAARALGADAVQMGTRFLVVDEADVHVHYKNALLSASETDTEVTDVYSGRPARGLYNRFAQECDSPLRKKHRVLDPTETVAKYPFQQSLTNPIKAKSLELQRGELGSMWCGQGVSLSSESGLEALIEEIDADYRALQQRISRFQ